jgi:hypothetical protein
VAGCDDSPLAILDTRSAAPVIRTADVTPDLFSLAAMTPSNGVYQVISSVTVTATDPDGVQDIVSAECAIVDPVDGTTRGGGTLIPVTGPVDSLYRVFSGVAQFSFTREGARTYRVEITVTDRSGLRSGSSLLPLTIRPVNSNPLLGTPSLRGTMIGASDTVRFAVSVAVSDSEGYATISAVHARPLVVTDSSRRELFDDGLAAHGDAFPGDGVFSGVFVLRPVNTPQDVVFEFSAEDRDGGGSAIVRRRFDNRPPTIEALVVPSTIQRPMSGTSVVSFFLRASDPDGLGDIDSVYFRNLTSTSPTSILMYDDGDLTAHGDSTAGDGTWSRALTIDATTTPGAKDFRFRVTDKGGDAANQQRTITIN